MISVSVVARKASRSLSADSMTARTHRVDGQDTCAPCANMSGKLDKLKMVTILRKLSQDETDVDGCR